MPGTDSIGQAGGRSVVGRLQQVVQREGARDESPLLLEFCVVQHLEAGRSMDRVSGLLLVPELVELGGHEDALQVQRHPPLHPPPHRRVGELHPPGPIMVASRPQNICLFVSCSKHGSGRSGQGGLRSAGEHRPPNRLPDHTSITLLSHRWSAPTFSLLLTWTALTALLTPFSLPLSLPLSDHSITVSLSLSPSVRLWCRDSTEECGRRSARCCWLGAGIR